MGHHPIVRLLIIAMAMMALRGESAVARQETVFGLMTGEGLPVSQRLTLMQEMGATHYRPLSIFLDRDDRCPDCTAALAAGMQLVLTVRANGGPPGEPATPPADLAAYQAAVDRVLVQYPPAVLVVENEQNSRQLFYDGTPAQYMGQLAAACAVAHARGIACTDGGLTNAAISALVTQHYWNSAQQDEALRYARATLSPLLGIPLRSTAELERLLTREAEEIGRLQEFITGFAAAGADYVNFHWYLTGDMLGETVDWLRAATGLPVLSNEIGQRNDDPEQTISTLAAARAAGLPVVIWYSIDTPGSGARARALWEPDGTLRATGHVWKEHVRAAQGVR